MGVRIRLRRIGKNPKKRPYFRVAVYTEERGRDSSFIEEIGSYYPISGKMLVNQERFDFWVKRGALPTESVDKLVKRFKKEAKNAAVGTGS